MKKHILNIFNFSDSRYKKKETFISKMPVDLLTKEGRQACWDAKDNFWKCVDEYKGDHTKCKPQREVFERDCSKAWVFNKIL